MKQSAAKTLGVAALGAAFAATGAGAANAAPAVPDATQALGSVSEGLPTENVTKALPGGGESLAQAQPTLGAGLATVQPAVEKVLADGRATPVAGLLGGLPAGQLLLGGDSSLNGLPLG
ncbi:hypothetical protein QFZ22_004048 [Streptomyces canus]|uniref:ATP-binding protein n=1 Tax=Streptomyces canus TaxID=58343 RepID=A0AAW8FGW1_9ACTN|nr:ATP-binding protein [Streptomyces canus]MDQ0908063.1 hypothetical protein [Streptomyces canus]